MKKIIHLSDLHVGYQVCGAKFARIVTNIIFTKEPAVNYVVVVTGDLVETALQEQNYAEVKASLDRLTNAGFTVLVAPGNHDYGTGWLGSPAYVTAFKQTFFGTTTVEYPKLDIIEGVAFIGLDSMAEEVNWYDMLFAQGELGRAQLKRLTALLKREDVSQCEKRVVYLHHHPFSPQPLHELKDSERLRQAIQNKVDVLLFGHNHEGKTWNGKWGIPRCYDGGSSTHKQGAPGPHRVIDLSRDPRLDYDGDFL